MKTCTLVLSLLLLLVPHIHSHTLTGECGTLYTEKNKAGASSPICHHENLATAFNDKVSSILVPKGFNMRLFRDRNRAGPWIDITGGLWNAPAEWDDTISSVLYNNWGGCATFYAGAGLTGKSFVVCETGNLVSGFNDKIASVAVPARHFFRFYTELNQKGDWYDVRGKADLKADFVDNVKSMKLQHWNDCAFLYTGKNKKGKLFRLCDSATYLPSGYDDIFSSIDVPKKMTLTLYKDANYKGGSLTIGQGVWNAPSDWDKTISSVRVKIEGAMTS